MSDVHQAYPTATSLQAEREKNLNLVPFPISNMSNFHVHFHMSNWSNFELVPCPFSIFPFPFRTCPVSNIYICIELPTFPISTVSDCKIFGAKIHSSLKEVA